MFLSGKLHYLPSFGFDRLSAILLFLMTCSVLKSIGQYFTESLLTEVSGFFFFSRFAWCSGFGRERLETYNVALIITRLHILNMTCASECHRLSVKVSIMGSADGCSIENLAQCYLILAFPKIQKSQCSYETSNFHSLTTN